MEVEELHRSGGDAGAEAGVFAGLVLLVGREDGHAVGAARVDPALAGFVQVQKRVAGREDVELPAGVADGHARLVAVGQAERVLAERDRLGGGERDVPPDALGAGVEGQGGAVAEALGDSVGVILRANGMLAAGHSVAHASVLAIFMEETAELQLKAMAAGLKPDWYTPESAARRHGDDRVHEPIRAWEYYVSVTRGEIVV